ncbi:DNA polymerase III subunit gamma/tau [Marinobacterium nitratireducens]|uniref:DNA polymerase III subunit gamma/tau n=1 Tax=Marinobacterium nitratireducens TaxID=518897 RepID=A0A918DSI9_9GAMM|nr:DNA polymerase III subunit gamma/tau [Marinobacterium nitratireducens]GGO80354.1 DNA polymerase III subunit gamma/tau [Marinobacterium nitratireducens]
MSYQVLARKWRPKRFQEMVGQEHVLKALVNALDDDRLHHAYLFTGTRGVGKTSIARLFAKSLNCETGVSSDPCGQCSACREIAEGRFVDLIEVDAASRTKVEDTRELLENVQYAPTHGRYKVYLIDEVHMLSTHSFNALLKTLEEPPPHVKFLLATTDPQKLPVTILSRCLQFNLKNLIPERIVEHLQFVLGQENIAYEEPALWQLARSADGSMRDAMSLTDQAIAFGAGQVTAADVQAMLGTIDQRLVYRLVESLAAQDPKTLLAAVEELARFSPDYASVLGDLISLLHRIAIAQVLPDAADNSLGDLEQVLALAQSLTAEDVQLYYQIALMGRRDLPFVPDGREGLEMVLLRMLAFRPADAEPGGAPALSASVTPEAKPAPVAQASAPAAGLSKPAPAAQQPAPDVGLSKPVPMHPPRQPASEGRAEAAPEVPAPAIPDSDPPPWELDSGPGAQSVPDLPPAPPEYDEADIPAYDEGEAPGVAGGKKPEPPPSAPVTEARRPDAVPGVPAAAAPPAQVETAPAPAGPAVDAPDPAPQSERLVLERLRAEDWVALCHGLGLSGMTASLVANLSLDSVQGGVLRFHYTAQQEALLSETQRDRIRQALRDYFDPSVEVEFEVGVQRFETPHQYQLRKRQERQAQAVRAIEQDPLVQAVLSQFDASIDLESVIPVEADQ